MALSIKSIPADLATLIARLKSGDEAGATQAHQSLVQEGSLLTEFQQQRVNGIMAAQIEGQQAVQAASDEQAPGKRRKAEGKLPDTLQRQWEALRLCNPRAVDRGLLFSRAKARDVELLFGLTQRSFLEQHRTVAEVALTYLDISDLASISCCSVELNHRINVPNPRIWKAVAATFPFNANLSIDPCSRASVRAYTLQAKRIYDAFGSFSSVPAMGLMALRESRIEQLGYRPTGARTQVRELVQPVLPSFLKMMGPHPLISFLKGYTAALGAYGSIYLQNAVLMLFRCGEKGDISSLSQVADIVVQNAERLPRNELHFPRAYNVGCAALSIIAEEGSLPAEFGAWDQFTPHRPLSTGVEMVMTKASPNYREVLFRELAKRMKISDWSVHRALHFGPIDLIPLMLEKHPKIPERALQAFFSHNPDMFNGPIKFHRDNTYNVQAILRAVDLLHKPSEQITDEASHTIFENSARVGSQELMQKVVSLGMKPNNTETVWNSLACAIAGCIRFISGATIAPDFRASLTAIGLMVQFGAKPSQVAFACIENYSDDPAVRERLTQILSQALTH